MTGVVRQCTGSDDYGIFTRVFLVSSLRDYELSSISGRVPGRSSTGCQCVRGR